MFSFNAEHFYFLHDLIISYIKEKEKGTELKIVNSKTFSLNLNSNNY
jgi:hypothetical protein